MASNEDDPSDAESKKCRYCKNNVDKSFVKCVNCPICYHSSCALRISGLTVASGSKNLVYCATCAKTAREDEINRAVSAVAKPESKESNVLRAENNLMKKLIREMESKNEILQENCNLLKEKMSSLQEKSPAPAKKVNKSTEDVATMRSIGGPSQVVQMNNSNGADAQKGKSNVNVKNVESGEVSTNGRHQNNTDKLANPASNIISASKVKAGIQEAQTMQTIKALQDLGTSNHKLTKTITPQAPQPSVTNTHVVELEDGSDEKNWTLVKRRAHRERYPEQSRPEPVRGESTDFGMSVASQRSYLFVSGLDVKTTEEELKKYIHDRLQIPCRAFKMKTRKDNFKSSFKLEIPTEARQAVMSPSIWGMGIVINHFLHLRRRPLFRENPMEKMEIQV